MTFLSYNDPAYRQRLNLSDTSLPMDDKPTPGLVTTPDGRAFLVEKGLRGATQYAGQEGATQYEGGTEDWMWRDPKTGQEHYLSDYADNGAKLYDTSESSIEALREREGRGVLDRGGFDRGAWVGGMTGADPNQLAGATTYWDVAEQADDADSLGYLTRINPTVRKQIFDAAGTTMPAGLNKLSADDIAKLERTMYKIDPMSFGGHHGTSDFEQWTTGQASMGGVDPLYGRRTASAAGEYFKNPENLKFSPEFGLYNDGSAGFVGRPKKSALQQGMPFIAAAAALMGGAALGAFGAEAAGASTLGTGAELGYGNLLVDSAAAPSATALNGGSLFANGALNLTGNPFVDSALTSMGKNVGVSAITGRPITAQGVLTSGALGAASPFISQTLGDAGVTGTMNRGLTGATTGGLGALLGGGNVVNGAVSGGLGGTVAGMTGSPVLGAGAGLTLGRLLNNNDVTNAAINSVTPRHPTTAIKPTDSPTGGLVQYLPRTPTWLGPREASMRGFA